MESLGIGHLEIDAAVDSKTRKVTPKIVNEEMIETAIVDFVNRLFANHPELEPVDINFAAHVELHGLMTHYRRIYVTRSEGGETSYFHEVSPNIFPLVQSIVDSILAGFIPPSPHGTPPEGSSGHSQANPSGSADLLNVAVPGLPPGSMMHRGGQWSS